MSEGLPVSQASIDGLSALIDHQEATIAELRSQLEAAQREFAEWKQPWSEREAERATKGWEKERWPYEMCNCWHCVAWREAGLAERTKREEAERRLGEALAALGGAARFIHAEHPLSWGTTASFADCGYEWCTRLRPVLTPQTEE
jgi:hypothetical protein